MSHILDPKIRLADAPSVDGFGRLRVSNGVTLFDSRQLQDGRPLAWATKLVNSGTVTFNANKSSSTLAVTSTIGSRAVRQTKQAMIYQPGKSMLVYNSFMFGAGVTGISKRIGYFNDNNGIFLEQLGNTISFVIRSSVTGSPVDTKIPQSDWNLDALDGYGPSKITLDVTKVQLFVMDTQGLTTGRVRVGFVLNGVTYFTHQFIHTNIISTAFMSASNLPVRQEIVNLSAVTSGSFDVFATSVTSEGGYEPQGLMFCADRESSGLTVSTTHTPVISLRTDPTKLTSSIRPFSIELLSTGNSNFHWMIFLNPSLAGSDAASWTNINNSHAQYNVSRTTANTLVNGTGTPIIGGYGAGKTSINSSQILTSLRLGFDIDGTPDQLVVMVRTLTGSDTYYATITWLELT